MAHTSHRGRLAADVGGGVGVMRPLRIHSGPIMPLQRGMARRRRYNQALGNTLPYRLLWSRTAGYRAINRRRRALHDLALRDRAMWERLSQWGNRFRSVNDPIEAEVYRIRCELYCALASGVDTKQAFQAHYGRAKAACEAFNAKQEAILNKRRTWHNTDTGHFSPDEAWQRLRHAVRMYQQLTCGA